MKLRGRTCPFHERGFSVTSLLPPLSRLNSKRADAKCSIILRTLQHNNDPPGPHGVFHKLVGMSDLCKRYSFANLEA